MHILTSKCASRRNCVHFFNTSTSKSSLIVVCVLTCLLGNVLHATMPCTFPHCNFQEFRASFFYIILTSTSASRHDGVQFFHVIWPDGSAPATLASLLFDPPAPQNIGKIYGVSRLLYLFACSRTLIFCLSLSLCLSLSISISISLSLCLSLLTLFFL